MSATQATKPAIGEVIKQAWQSGTTEHEGMTRMLEAWLSFMYSHFDSLPHRYTPGYILSNRFTPAEPLRSSNLFSKHMTTNWFAGTVIAHPVRAGVRSNDQQDRLDPIIAMQGLWGFFGDSPRNIIWQHVTLEFRQKREYLEIYNYNHTVHETKGYVSWLLENGLKQSDLLLSLNGLLREWHERRAARAAESAAIFESMREAYVTSSRWCD